MVFLGPIFGTPVFKFLANKYNQAVGGQVYHNSGQSLPESRYMLFCRDRTSLSDFSLWLQKPWKRHLLGCPLAAQTHLFSMKVEKKGVWENNEKSLKIASAKKQKSDQKVCQNGGPSAGQIQGWKPSCPRGAPEPEKTQKSRPKSWKKDPRTTNNLGRKSAGNRHGFCFLNIYSSDFCQGVRRGATRNQHVRGT